MVAGTTATRTRTRKPQPPVTVKPVDVFAGLYSTLSSDGATWYSTDVKAVTCTCRAGADGFSHCKAMPYCKHMFASKLVARTLAHMAPADRAATLRSTSAIHVRVDVVLAQMATYEQAQSAAALPAAA